MIFSIITSPVRLPMPPICITLVSPADRWLPNFPAIERIENRREPNPEMDAIYFLSPEPHIVECLLADFERRRYRTAYLVWTNLIDPNLRRKIDDFPGVRQLRASSKTLFVDFYPRESNLITLRDPWSFPILYHRDCDSLVAAHLKSLAQKVRHRPNIPRGATKRGQRCYQIPDELHCTIRERNIDQLS